MNTHKMKMLCC